jgi:hypothetical protein
VSIFFILLAYIKTINLKLAETVCLFRKAGCLEKPLRSEFTQLRIQLLRRFIFINIIKHGDKNQRECRAD